MPRVTLVRYTTKPDRADENEALSRAVFAELKAKTPDNIVYAVFRDGQDFLHVFINTAGDAADPLTELAAFEAFGADAKQRYQDDPQVSRDIMDLVASYGLSRTLAPG